MPLQPGEIIDGKYRIVRLVGEGGMGAVYEGENTRIKRTVAIKVLHSAVAEKNDVVQRFEREAQAAGRIGSEHIVEVLDLGNLPSGERYMVMEFLVGEDLTGRIKRLKRIQPQDCVPLLHQVLDGLAAAHEAGIIHRDLKPDNIYILSKHVGRSDFVKILDFGVSKFSALDAEMSMTRTGAVMGTPYYMSPEQAKGGKIDSRSDLYAIGVVLYQMVTGRVPFNASSFNELLFKIALETPEPIEHIVPDCPASFIALVQRAMHRDANGRFQTAREFQQALGNWQLTAATAPAAPAALGTAGLPTTTVLPQVLDRPPLPSNPGLSQSNPMLSASYPGALTPIPGTNTPAGPLGMSHSALAVTPQPRAGRGGMMVALVAVTVGIVGAGGVGAYILTRSDAGPRPTPAATTEPTSQQTATPEPTAEVTATATAAPDSSATATAEPSASAAPPPTGPVVIGPRPLTAPPKASASAVAVAPPPPPTSQPSAQPGDKGKGGRNIPTGL